eukprot:m.105884 g.105884  ORF g.105884 m.105884 type:complete len:934 (+) comp9140_c2_seq2:428-3229(+)
MFSIGSFVDAKPGTLHPQERTHVLEGTFVYGLKVVRFGEKKLGNKVESVAILHSQNYVDEHGAPIELYARVGDLTPSHAIHSQHPSSNIVSLPMAMVTRPDQQQQHHQPPNVATSATTSTATIATAPATATTNVVGSTATKPHSIQQQPQQQHQQHLTMSREVGHSHPIVGDKEQSRKVVFKKGTSYFYPGEGRAKKTLAELGSKRSLLQKQVSLIDEEEAIDDNSLAFSIQNDETIPLATNSREEDKKHDEAFRMIRQETNACMNPTEYLEMGRTKIHLHLEETRKLKEEPASVQEDVIFKRISIEDDHEDRFEAPGTGHILLSAVTLRNKYMKKSLQPLSTTVSTIKHELVASEKKSTGLRVHRFPTVASPAKSSFACLKNADTIKFIMNKGVIHVCEEKDSSCRVLLNPSISVGQYLDDLSFILALISDGPTKSFCFQRVQLITEKFKIHTMLNLQAETAEQKRAHSRDFYTIPKVDTHIHLSACMHQRHLLEFIQRKARENPDEEVIFRDGNMLTLKEVFTSIDTDPESMTLDALDVHADVGTFHRFDKFNLKYNPLGESRLREIFLKTSNKIGGRYFGELTREVIDRVENASEEYAEYRVSVYGFSRDEFSNLAKWFVNSKLASKNIRWLIQVPRIYHVYRKKNILTNFQQMLENIFMPLFEVTNNPESDPDLATFLEHVTGFDSVDDESNPEPIPHSRSETPDIWTSEMNPPYSSYLYYMYTNISILNKFRCARGLNVFTLRPHAGEAGSIEHLACTFLLADSIAHGIELRKAPVLQYLYYLTQIGMSLSPLSNNSLFLDYFKIPFLEFHQLGLNVTLSTDDPMQFHLTSNPLIEEYSIAAQVWKLSQVDLSEIARNSGLISGFSHEMKTKWYGSNYTDRSVEGNDPLLTNVPQIRSAFRHECIVNEVELLLKSGSDADNSKIASTS